MLCAIPLVSSRYCKYKVNYFNFKKLSLYNHFNGLQYDHIKYPTCFRGLITPASSGLKNLDGDSVAQNDHTDLYKI